MHAGLQMSRDTSIACILDEDQDELSPHLSVGLHAASSSQ